MPSEMTAWSVIASLAHGASGITSAFNAVPDVPITRFVLDLPQGPHSALSASKGLCGGGLTMAWRTSPYQTPKFT